MDVGTVLFVDDDAGMRSAILRLFGAARMKIVAFESAEQLLASELPRRIACVVADMKLTGISGLALLDRLREKGESAPSILITGLDNPSVRLEADRRGIGFLAKPFPGEVLLSAVRALSEFGSY